MITDNQAYIRKFKRLVKENIEPYYREELNEDDPNAGPVDPNAPAAPMPGQEPAPADPNIGGAPAPAPADPNMGGAPATAPAQQPAPTPGEAPGFTPQDTTQDANGGNQTPDAQPASGDDVPENEPDETNDETKGEIEDLKKSQKGVEDKIDKLSDSFERLIDKLDNLNKQIDDNNANLEKFKVEMEKRNPTDTEKMSLRSLQSGPFKETPKEFWDKKERTSNYSAKDDNNGVDEPKYQIKQSDIDNVNDWANISKSFNQERMGLRDLLGY